MSDPVHRPPGSVTVLITVLRDPRVARTIESVLRQRRMPEVLLIDDGGITDEVHRITSEWAARDARVRYLLAPGGVAESRNIALASVATEFVAFIDADEVAPPEWLERLIAPLSDPAVGFTGGPTPALPGTARGAATRFYDGYLRRFYDQVASHRPHALPMGNSAWRMAVFDQVGALDTSFRVGTGNEDLDVALRALSAGWKGRYLPDAFVYHDFSDLTLRRILSKQARYAEGGFAVWRRSSDTYEATPGRVTPFILPPLVALAGIALWILPSTRVVGEWFLILSGMALGALALGLTVLGLGQEDRYPGLKFNALEILRRWATLLGAARGLRRHGWKGRRVEPGERHVALGGKP